MAGVYMVFFKATVDGVFLSNVQKMQEMAVDSLFFLSIVIAFEEHGLKRLVNGDAYI